MIYQLSHSLLPICVLQKKYCVRLENIKHGVALLVRSHHETLVIHMKDQPHLTFVLAIEYKYLPQRASLAQLQILQGHNNLRGSQDRLDDDTRSKVGYFATPFALPTHPDNLHLPYTVEVVRIDTLCSVHSEVNRMSLQHGLEGRVIEEYTWPLYASLRMNTFERRVTNRG